MLNDKLLNEKYYSNKLSLSMQNDELMIARVHDLFLFLKAYTNSMDNITVALKEILYNILDSSIDLDDYIYNDLLEKIAACFNLQRDFIIELDQTVVNSLNNTYSTSYFSTTMSLHLTNQQLRCLIYCNIMKNAYDGSRSSIVTMYNILQKKFKLGTNPLSIYESTFAAGICKVCLDIGNFDFSNNDTLEDANYIVMFLANLLTIQSMGIEYTTAIVSSDNLLWWNPKVTTTGKDVWTKGRWQ